MLFYFQVTASEALSAKLDNSFILICLNRFQQIVAVHTFQAESEQLRVIKKFFKQVSGLTKKLS